MPQAAGVDLAGSRRRPTGVAVLRGGVLAAFEVFGDRELLEAIRGSRVVAVDSPLTLPRRLRGFRDVDIALKKMGYRVLPPLWPHMRLLTLRGIALSHLLSEAGVHVIETHPRSALLASGCRDPLGLIEKILPGITTRVYRRSRHVLDAIVCLAVAIAWIRGSAVPVEGGEGVIYLLPKLC